MKRVLLIGFLNNTSSVHGGYTSASQGIADVLIEMEKREIIEEVVFIDVADLSSAMLHVDIDVCIIIWSPENFSAQKYRTNIEKVCQKCKEVYLSLVWETRPLPKRWDFLWDDSLFTGFVSPSYFVLEQIKEKTDKPCYYLPHYIDVSLYEPLQIEDKLKEEEFKVLFIGQHTERKGFRDATIGFLHSLSGMKDCSFLIKYHEMSSSSLSLEEEVQFLIKMNKPLEGKIQSSIYVLSQDLDKNELIQLYKESSLLLCPSRGEGFGLPPAECMSVGIPVIYTDWSSMPEVCEAPANIPISYTEDIAYNMSQHGYESYQSYAVPNKRSIANALMIKYKEWDDSKKRYYEEGMKSRKIIEDRFGLNKIIEYLQEIIK